MLAAEKHTLKYEVYAGGIHAVQAVMQLDLTQPKKYDVSLQAQTRGFLGSLAPWEGTFESNGWLADSAEAYIPAEHVSTAIWREDRETKEYKYNKDRTFSGLFITEHEQPTRKEKVDSELTDGTTDILSAALNVFQNVSQGQNCNGTSEIFDGKRRFEIAFKQQKNETLQASKYNIYEGQAVQCTVEIKPVAGEWHKKPRGWMSIQEQGRERGTMPTIWLGQLFENGPFLPVKIRVKTDYGTLFMHLAEYHSGSNIQVAEKRVDE